MNKLPSHTTYYVKYTIICDQRNASAYMDLNNLFLCIIHYTGDTELIESLLFDAAATRGALANWLKVNRDGTPNDVTSQRYIYTSLDNMNIRK